MTSNPHFETVSSWKAARKLLTFRPLEPGYTAKRRLRSLRIHVLDHKMRSVSLNDRSLEAHYGDFVLSQAHKGVEEAQRMVLAVSYGRGGHDELIAGRAARVCQLGPEVPPDDIDGRMPAVVAWHDAELFCLLASDTMPSDQLIRIARSLYGQARRAGKVFPRNHSRHAGRVIRREEI